MFHRKTDGNGPAAEKDTNTAQAIKETYYCFEKEFEVKKKFCKSFYCSQTNLL